MQSMALHYADSYMHIESFFQIKIAELTWGKRNVKQHISGIPLLKSNLIALLDRFLKESGLVKGDLACKVCVGSISKK